jgi:hypothetical protein
MPRRRNPPDALRLSGLQDYETSQMKDIKEIEIIQRPPPPEPARRTNPLARVFDELVRFCQSRSMFMPAGDRLRVGQDPEAHHPHL